MCTAFVLSEPNSPTNSNRGRVSGLSLQDLLYAFIFSSNFGRASRHAIKSSLKRPQTTWLFVRMRLSPTTNPVPILNVASSMRPTPAITGLMRSPCSETSGQFSGSSRTLPPLMSIAGRERRSVKRSSAALSSSLSFVAGSTASRFAASVAVFSIAATSCSSALCFGIRSSPPRTIARERVVASRRSTGSSSSTRFSMSGCGIRRKNHCPSRGSLSGMALLCARGKPTSTVTHLTGRRGARARLPVPRSRGPRGAAGAQRRSWFSLERRGRDAADTGERPDELGSPVGRAARGGVVVPEGPCIPAAQRRQSVARHAVGDQSGDERVSASTRERCLRRARSRRRMP